MNDDRSTVGPAAPKVFGQPSMASFDQIAVDFWHAENKHGRLAPLTDDLEAVARRELGVTLPPDLIRLLRIQNGGVVADAWDACPAESNFYSEDHVPFETVFGIGPAGQTAGLTMLDNSYLIGEWDLPEPIVLLAGEGHYWVALDYRECGPNGKPTVTWIDTEMDHELPLAPDFRSFIERLRPSSSFAD